MKTAFFIFLMLLSSVAHADADAAFEEASGYIRSPLSTDYDYKKVFEIADSLNRQGDCRGDVLLGTSYLTGLRGYIKEDINKARDIYLRSANAGCAEAMYRVGEGYAHTIGSSLLGLPLDLNKAVYWLSKSYDLDIGKNKMQNACYTAKKIATVYYSQNKYSDSLGWYQKMQKAGSKLCADYETLIRVSELEKSVQNQAEAMRDDPPVAGVTLSLGGDAKPSKKSKKKN